VGLDRSPLLSWLRLGSILELMLEVTSRSGAVRNEAHLTILATFVRSLCILISKACGFSIAWLLMLVSICRVGNFPHFVIGIQEKYLL